MKAREAERASTERDNGRQCLDPTYALRRCDNAQAKIHSVTCMLSKLLVRERWRVLLTRLHAHERAPYEDSRAIQQPSNDVAIQQNKICPVLRNIGIHVPFEPLHSPLAVRFSAGWSISAEKRRFLVCAAARGVSARYAAHDCTRGRRSCSRILGGLRGPVVMSVGAGCRQSRQQNREDASQRADRQALRLKLQLSFRRPRRQLQDISGRVAWRPS